MIKAPCNSSTLSSASPLTPTSPIFHVACFETQFDLDGPDGFGKIYPAASTSSSSLDDSAKTLVNAWKLQRRREGLETAAGPDSGIRADSASCSCPCGDTAGKVGVKRSSVHAEIEEERKRAKYYTSDDGSSARQLRLDGKKPRQPVRSSSDKGSALLASSSKPRPCCGCGCLSAGRLCGGKGTLDLSHLPLKLSEALGRLEEAKAYTY